ncbi:MAG: GTP pyrophosphokinase [Desulfobulbaceae bacterium DB1]|nr:MAG: GTP pyrophosphokinase [Desulfobulbaceae bacterium DB1]
MHNSKFDIATYCRKMEKIIGGQEGKAALFWKALSFSVDAHQNQKRKSGEAYVSHPCQVALILVDELGVKDPATLAAAMLHDTIEDVPEVTTDIISSLFGKHVAAIVDGCTKISHFSGDRQTFYKLVHRKIFSSAASRVEIMLIKLADRLHNLRTMVSMPKHKRQKIADETLSVYAPMAGVMGLFGLKRELYDLALTYKFPRQSQKVLTHIRFLETQEEGNKVVDALRDAFEEAWVSADIRLKAKGLWAYYNVADNVLAKHIENPLEIIIVVDDLQSCYRALGIINQHFPPIPRTIRDFIANPKPTGYKSLHARANIKGQNYLFKIRTLQMVHDAKKGIIREWLSLGTVPTNFEQEIREMFGILGTDDSLSYREMIAASGKKEIYTFTPNGDCICLPSQSIVLDFAFKVHTEVGLHCNSATVGAKRVKADHVLKDGDRIQINTQERPVKFDPEILPRCQTPRARSELARLFRLKRETLAREIGKSLVKQELQRYGVPFSVLDYEETADILEYFGKENLSELFQDLGQGNLRLKELVYEIKNGLYAGRQTLLPPTGALNSIDLETLDPECVKLSQCCQPLPIEKSLLGLLSERGLSVHKKECPKLNALKIQREDVVALRWNLKKTMVEKPQSLLIYKNVPRNRIFMLLSVAPVAMKISEVIALSTRPDVTAWEINFTVETLQDLKNTLQHFTKSKLEYEFMLEL